MVGLDNTQASQPISILLYDRNYWRTLWELRHHQLAEFGIIIPPEEIPDEPLNVGQDDYEWDYHHISEVYLHGAGGFWLAWWENDPAGHIGGQDLGGVIELRHMYVRSAYRQRGIATCLVQTLLDHSKIQSIKAVELWTAKDGLGRRLYERMGFRITLAPGKEFSDLLRQTNFIPREDQIRMRLDF
ncbi:MAG: GNAT family N-acetyltransferase [Anaerolineaceae bacterium]